MTAREMSVFKQIHKFNKEAGLLSKNNRELESSMLLEEVYEGLNIDKPKEKAREFIASNKGTGLDTVDWVDSLLDLIVVASGSLFKLGLKPQDTMTLLGFVAEANLHKLTVGTDSEGKQMKPDGFVGPEERIRKFLDKKGIK